MAVAVYVRDQFFVPFSQCPQTSPLTLVRSSLSLSLGVPFSGDVNALLQREIAHVIKSLLHSEHFFREVLK